MQVSDSQVTIELRTALQTERGRQLIRNADHEKDMSTGADVELAEYLTQHLRRTLLQEE